MIKVAYNACYGGFSISREAAMRLETLEPGVTWGLNEEHPLSWDSCSLDYDFPRHNKNLIYVIESMYKRGLNPSGSHSDIKVAKIESNKYFIEEYDGMEHVVTPENLEKRWIIVNE